MAGFDTIIVPDSFSYDDYLHADAIASLAPVMTKIVEANPFKKKKFPTMPVNQNAFTFQKVIESG